MHIMKFVMDSKNIFGRTLPAGYMELGESAAEGAARETLEEACAEVEVVSPFAQLDIPLIGQVGNTLSFVNKIFYFTYFLTMFHYLWCHMQYRATSSSMQN